MGISSSLYAGISGLSTMGNAMSVLGDNIANVNTIAFKSSKSTFEDVLSQSVSTASGSSQIGRGVTLSTVDGIFAQGSFESSDSPTHLAINGEGFFILRDPASAAGDMYSRAGQFRFDDNAFLVNPAGDFVQGWSLDPLTGLPIGSIGDITLVKTTPPQETTNIQGIVNLDVRNTEASVNPLIGGAGGWDGTASPSVSSSEYYFASSLKIYDSLGDSHDVTTYFDRTTIPNQWEFLVTCDPSEDVRMSGVNPYSGDVGAGALMYGTITFDATGSITQISASDVDYDGTLVAAPKAPAASGYFEFVAAFIETAPTVPVNQTIAYNFGALATGAGGPVQWNFAPETLASTQFANNSTTYYQDQNGFSAGFLQSVSIDPDGVVSGHYSNGQVLQRARLALATFNNLVGLNKAGGNIYTETTNSGVALIGTAGSVGLGSIAPNSLEQSNVDLGTEFVKLITTQRGFQANSKILTTVDEMMAELVNLKR